MTNAEIIFREACNLMKEGIIGTTGRMIQMENEKGEKITVPEPEVIHTYAGWKEKGYQVQKGEKAIAKFSIWKYSKKKNKETDEDEERMFLTSAAFFKASQVQAI